MGVTSCCFSYDRELLVTGSEDRTAKVWRCADRILLRTLTGPYGHSRGIINCTFSPDGQLILTGSTDGTAKLWSCPENRPGLFSELGAEITNWWHSAVGTPYLIATFKCSDSSAIFFSYSAFSHDSQLILTGSEEAMVFWRPVAEGRGLTTKYEIVAKSSEDDTYSSRSSTPRGEP